MICIRNEQIKLSLFRRFQRLNRSHKIVRFCIIKVSRILNSLLLSGNLIITHFVGLRSQHFLRRQEEYKAVRRNRLYRLYSESIVGTPNDKDITNILEA